MIQILREVDASLSDCGEARKYKLSEQTLYREPLIN